MFERYKNKELSKKLSDKQDAIFKHRNRRKKKMGEREREREEEREIKYE